MLPAIYLVHIRWEGVPGATSYQILVDGKAVAKAGAKARTTKVSVDDATLVEIIDLPARSRIQAIDLSQVSP